MPKRYGLQTYYGNPSAERLIREDEERREREQTLTRMLRAKGLEQTPSGQAVDYATRQAQTREKAQFDAANFEKRYTAKQKVEIARFTKAKQDLINNPAFSEQEKVTASRSLDMKIMGITPDYLPKMSQYPDGQGIGDSWEEHGGIVRRNEKGVKEIMFRPDQMNEGKLLAGKIKIDDRQLEHKLNIEGKIMDQRLKLLSTPKKSKDEFGNAILVDRTPDEVERIIQNSFSVLSQSKQQQQGPTSGIMIQSEEEYDHLPSGSVFVGPDGKRRRKP